MDSEAKDANMQKEKERRKKNLHSHIKLEQRKVSCLIDQSFAKSCMKSNVKKKLFQCHL